MYYFANGGSHSTESASNADPMAVILGALGVLAVGFLLGYLVAGGRQTPAAPKKPESKTAKK